ncbi:MAG: DUF2325 domain-containing protein [Eubacterium sp.]|nr:DUF2325 domain-containing protein [Eubacterium sp.]MCH4046226.1 DUF2325 domain-containing protein [Eubacterium sp.]MCH4079321.1 DUF2325 domain-containing protein [Eubacterium sp.]MCH4110545.1 DUF2325 domain-containing protein [Eubacterium sp.]MCI1307709.1 DUF2325 domain-containing protein [Eubacterium sp.]
MSVVILGGNERMERKYADICKEYNYSAKVFTKIKSGLKGRIGNPDLLVMFTSTMSHKMVRAAVAAINEDRVDIVHAPSSSASALRNILQSRAEA